MKKKVIVAILAMSTICSMGLAPAKHKIGNLFMTYEDIINKDTKEKLNVQTSGVTYTGDTVIAPVNLLAPLGVSIKYVPETERIIIQSEKDIYSSYIGEKILYKNGIKISDLRYRNSIIDNTPYVSISEYADIIQNDIEIIDKSSVKIFKETPETTE